MSPRPSPAEKRERQKEALRHRADHHPPADQHTIAAHEKVRTWTYAFGALLIDTCPPSDELHHALRHLTDTVAAGCHAAIARHPDRLPSREPLPPGPVPGDQAVALLDGAVTMDSAAEAAFIHAHPEVAARLDTIKADDPDLGEVDLDALDPLPAVPGYVEPAVPPAVPPAVSSVVRPAEQLVVQWNGTGLGTVDLDSRVARLGARTEARTDETGGGADELHILLPSADVVAHDSNSRILILRKGEWLAHDDGFWAVGATMSDAIAKVVKA